MLFASTWDGSFIYAAPHITSLARLFVSRLNPAAVAAAAAGGLEALSPSPSEKRPPASDQFHFPENISKSSVGPPAPPDPSHRTANSVGFLDSDLAKTPGEWLARNTAVVV